MGENVKHTPHTPGPWSLDDHQVFADVGVYIATVATPDDFPCLDQDEETQIDVQAECEANARLIAAAPDLLAALKRALVELELHTSVRAVAEIEIARAAIAKAEGRP